MEGIDRVWDQNQPIGLYGSLNSRYLSFTDSLDHNLGICDLRGDLWSLDKVGKV